MSWLILGFILGFCTRHWWSLVVDFAKKAFDAARSKLGW
jgi:hypothetical protein